MNERIIAIRGERNSGTNWVRKLILLNFKIKWLFDKNTDADGYYGWKHGFLNNLHIKKLNNDNAILLILHKNIFYWLVSMYEKPYCNCYKKCKSFSEFLRAPYKLDIPYNKENAENIVKLRTRKLNNWIESEVKNKYVLNYDNVNESFFRDLLKKETLKMKNYNTFTKVDNYTIHGRIKNYKFIPKAPEYIKSKYTKSDLDFVFSNMDLSLEENILGYDYSFFKS